MSGRVVLFGATGYTGELTARAMARRGLRPLLAGRRRDALDALAQDLGGLEIAVADVSRPGSLHALVERGDVLVSTVGPFVRRGQAALDAAIDAGAHYIDSAGEPAFVRRVFEHAGPRAHAAGSMLLPAMAYDSVPGNLVGALALREAGDRATAVRIGCFDTDGARDMSGGTRASSFGGLFEPGFAWRGGRIVTERAAARVGAFEVDGRRWRGVSAGTSEAFLLPRLQPGLRDVDVYLGWLGLDSVARALQVGSLLAASLVRVPRARTSVAAVANRYAGGSSGGPDERRRAATRSLFVAEVMGASGKRLALVTLRGINGYDFSANALAWAADRLAAGVVAGRGALGPVEAFGLDQLEAGVAECGIARVRD